MIDRPHARNCTALLTHSHALTQLQVNSLKKIVPNRGFQWDLALEYANKLFAIDRRYGDLYEAIKARRR